MYFKFFREKRKKIYFFPSHAVPDEIQPAFAQQGQTRRREVEPLVSLMANKYSGLLASFFYDADQCCNPFCTSKNALRVSWPTSERMRVCVRGACDSTKMLGYHALMCMSNPLVRSHNLPAWLCRSGSAGEAERHSVDRVLTSVTLVLFCHLIGDQKKRGFSIKVN